MAISLTGASSAARKQRQAIEAAQRAQEAAFGETEESLSPWLGYEREAARLASYETMAPFEESYYMTSLRDMPSNPIYQALQQAGIEATQAGLAGAGGLYGGNATEAYSDVGRQALMQAYGSTVSNYDKYMQRLNQMASPQVTMGLGNLRMGTAANVGQLGMQAADTYMSQANARQAMLGDLISAGATAIGGMAGGPAGAMAGSQIGGQISQSLKTSTTPVYSNDMRGVDWGF